jgi:hypothetical protein
MTERNIPNPAIFQPCEFSYLGAVAGLLQSLGKPCDGVDVGGYSGYAFLMKTTEGWIDPGSPSFHSGNAKQTPEAVLRLWSDFRAGTESLDVRLECVWDPKQFAFWDETQHAENERRAQHLFERVKREIDVGRPAIVWGLFVPEYGLVNGYTQDSYVVSTFRSLIGQPDEPVRYDQLQAKGGLEAIFVGAMHPPASQADDQLALTRAILMAEGSAYAFTFETPRHPIREHQRYITGVAAYDEWTRVLEQYAPDTIYYEYLSYNAACAMELKQVAGQFLNRLAERYRDRPQAEALSRAAAAYEQAEAELRQLVELFPFAETGDISAIRCAQAAASLRAAKPHEQMALEFMQQASKVWK